MRNWFAKAFCLFLAAMVIFSTLQGLLHPPATRSERGFLGRSEPFSPHPLSQYAPFWRTLRPDTATWVASLVDEGLANPENLIKNPSFEVKVDFTEFTPTKRPLFTVPAAVQERIDEALLKELAQPQEYDDFPEEPSPPGLAALEPEQPSVKPTPKEQGITLTEAQSNVQWRAGSEDPGEPSGYLVDHWQGFPSYSWSPLALTGSLSMAFQAANSAKGMGASQTICLNSKYEIFLLSIWVNIPREALFTDELKPESFAVHMSVEYEDHTFAYSGLISLVPQQEKETVEHLMWAAGEDDWHHFVRPVIPDPSRTIRSATLHFTFQSTYPSEVLIDDVLLWGWKVGPPLPKHRFADAFGLQPQTDSACRKKIVQNYYLPHQMVTPEKDSVTLATQLSFDRVDHLIMLAKNWDGPLSIALYVPESLEKYGAQLVKQLVAAEENIRQNAKIHLIFERGDDCPYPINFLRNIALLESVTPYTLIMDVDMLVSPGAYRGIQKEIRSFFKTVAKGAVQRLKTAFVIPSFELLHSPPFPSTKQMLIGQLEEGKAIPFLFQKKVAAQFSTNYAHWMKATTPYPIAPSDQYEPFLVVPTSLKHRVLFDDKLTGYGLNKVLYTEALVQQDVSFFVLSRSYIVHLPHKTSKEKEKWLNDTTARMKQGHYLQTFKQCPKSAIPQQWSSIHATEEME